MGSYRDFDFDEGQKLMKVLEFFLSLHEADEIFSAIFDEDVSCDNIVWKLGQYRKNSEKEN